MTRREALMHLDGCHFYVWVVRDPDGSVVVQFADRRGSDLAVHGRFGGEDGRCDECAALRSGRMKPRSVARTIDVWPDDARESLGAVFETVAAIESEAVA